MLPWIFSAGEGGENDNEADNNGGGGGLEEYYQNYERDQKRMHDMQMEAVRKRDEAMGRRPRRSRSTSRSRSASRNRSRSRGRSRSRSRSRRHRSRTRSRSHSRSRDRSRERRRYRGRSRSPRRRSRSRSRGRDRGYDRDRNDKNERDTNTAPSNKLAMMSLPHDVDRNMITMAMAAEGFLPQDVRVIHRGTTRSFGFIDFADIDSAVKWMEATEGWLILTDGRHISVQYAKPDPASGGRISNNDWICANCTCNNFFKREACFKCDTPKAQSDDMERAGMHMIGVVPCDTLLIRNLPPGVSTATIFEGLIKNVNLACIIQLQLADSHQHAFIQMRSTDDATLLVNSSYKNPIKIENHDAILTYCKHPLKEILRQQQIALHAATAQPLPTSGGPVSGAEVAHAAMMRLAQNKGNEVQGYNPYGQKQHPYFNPVVQQQIQQPPPVQQPKQQPGVIGTTNTPHGVLPKYATPNPVTFVLDQSTGYFRDPVTGFLYDAKSCYYYMQESGVWACWDSTYCTYFSVSAVPESQEATAAEVKKEEPKEKTAVDVTKQMQKWAKKQEKQKLQITMKPLVKPLGTKSAFDKPGPSNSGNDSESKVIPVEEPIRRSFESEDEDSPNASRKKSFEEPVPNRRLPSMQEQREMMELALIDEGKKMCLLCKRAFPTVDVLRKHVDKSDLHKKNLEEKRSEWARKYADDTVDSSVPDPDPTPKLVYRDRAKERRAQYGLDGGYGKEDFASAGSGGPKNAESLRREAEAKAATPLDSNNIGNKLLKSMGWKEGQGAGKYGQGIVNPIEAVRRVEGAGLGSSGSRILHSSESTHKERVRASMFNRFREISEQQP